MSEQAVATKAEIIEGQIFSCKVDGEAVLVTRVDGTLKAYSAKCPHMGMSLASGKVNGKSLTCRFHGAEFDLATGNNIKWVDSFVGMPLPKWSHKILSMGKEPCGLKHYNVNERDGQVFVSVR